MIMPTARRVILWRTQHTRRVFVERLEFVSAAGNVDRVVTPLCVLQRRDGRLQVEAIMPTSSAEEVTANTGFPLDIPAGCTVLAPPTAQELALLEEIDPGGVRNLEFRER
jgi:glutaconate CoA-transferase subunit B